MKDKGRREQRRAHFDAHTFCQVASLSLVTFPLLWSSFFLMNVFEGFPKSDTAGGCCKSLVGVFAIRLLYKLNTEFSKTS